jgi:hypothetical protein
MTIDLESRKQEVDGLIEAGAMISIPKRFLGSYREAAGLKTWNALSKRSGVHIWHFTKSDLQLDTKDSLAGNFNVEIWLRIALAVGRHPFAIARVTGAVPEFDLAPYQKIYRRAESDLWGWDADEIDRAVKDESARILLDRRNLADVRDAAGIESWRELSKACGLAVHTIQKLNYPGNNPAVLTVMRIALAVQVHPFSLLRVSFPPM